MNRFAWMPTSLLALVMTALAGCGDHQKAALDELAAQGLTEVTLTKVEGGDAWGVTGKKDGQACEGVIRVSSPVGASKPTFESKLKCGSTAEAAKETAAPAAPEPVEDEGPSAELAKACDGGAMDKCRELATALIEGPPGTRDPERARALHGKACDGGQMASCDALGTLLIRGLGGEQDEPKAAELFKKACDAGYMDGCASEGRVFYINRKFKDARPLFQKACDGGSIRGCVALATALREGAGGGKDLAEARRLYDTACAAGDTTACTNLGVMLAEGEGGPKNPQRAKKLLGEACELKDEVACARLRQLK